MQDIEEEVDKHRRGSGCVVDMAMILAKLSDIFRISETEDFVWLLLYFWRHGFSG